jgi:nucleoside phosphorylase
VTDFATFIGAVKPRERTPQYLVLAALFCLAATSKPVAARQISELLRLHFRKYAPPNVNDVLRKNATYVTPKEKGPPIQWLLTPAGIDRLRLLSGLALATAPDAESFGSDIGIVCALEHPEFTAVANAFGGDSKWKDVGDARLAHMYRETEVVTGEGARLRVIGTTSTSMGLTAAAIATTQLIMSYRPRLVLMIGIAAGTRTSDKQFGDVLVADPSVDYNSGKVALQNGIREFLPDPYPIGINARLRSVLKKYGNRQDVFTSIRGEWKGRLPPGTNKLHVGPLGAADQVIDDASRVLEIQKSWRKLIGVEMEAYGVYRACHESPEPKPRFASFKAVCDFAAEKSDSWQEYAAFVAAKFSHAFVTSEWSALWPPA